MTSLKPEKMSAIEDRISRNLSGIRRRIEAAAARAERDIRSVRLIAVTKTVGVEEVEILNRLGVGEMGENRPELAMAKIGALPKSIAWHMIAPLQSRKASDIVSAFEYFDALDRIRAGEALQRRCEEQDRVLKVLIEMNVSGEQSKHGFAPGDLPGCLAELGAFDRLQVRGLMTMAPFDAEESFLRKCFRKLKALADEHGLSELSMGMTDDFEIAIEEGATQVRIGRALFE
jgi:pyridoxal phosphate enzyme (YggS family)